MGNRRRSSCVPFRAVGFLALAALIALPAAAEQVRIASGPASVTQWRMAGETIATLPVGTFVEVVDYDDPYYWVILPPDRNGVRRAGWINGLLLDIPASAERAHVGAPDVPSGKPPAPVDGSTDKTATTRPPRWLVQAVGGANFGTETSQFFGASAGASITPTLQLTMDIGRMGDLTSSAMRDSIEASAERAGQILSLVTGRRFDVVGEARMPATYGTAGLRYTVPRTTRSRPYAGGHIGFARVSPSVQLLIGDEDVTANFLSPDDRPLTHTRLLMGFGSGFTIQATRAVSLDVGYRYSRLFADDGVNVNRVYVALGYGF